MTMLKTTALNAAHRALGAKMVDFSGWDMPLHYGSQIEEHHKVRRDVGMFDVSHMLAIDLHGAGSREFLRYLLANNVDRLQIPGKAMYSCMLNEQGGVLDDLIVYYLSEDWFRLVVNAGTADRDLAWIEHQRDAHAPGVTVVPRRDLAILAVQGPNARERVWLARPELRAATESLKPFQAVALDGWFVGRTGYTGEDGFEIILPAGEIEDFWWLLHQLGVAPAGLGARDTLRLEAGMNLYGQDMDETTTPLESGLAWTVDLKSPREFIGKHALEEQQVMRNLYGLVLLDPGVLRAHQRVITAHGEGETTSGSFAPTLNRSIALARLPVQVEVGDQVQVAVRDKLLAAKVVKYPFVRNGKSLID
ncbi:MAG: glycine cleavage system aminomethyltransferase GcvT [Burkholderiales bacterium]